MTPNLQREMYTETPCRKVVTIDTEHSPFLSRPAELVRHLVSLASPREIQARTPGLETHDGAPVRVHEAGRSRGG